jgi:hypothetical protein
MYLHMITKGGYVITWHVVSEVFNILQQQVQKHGVDSLTCDRGFHEQFSPSRHFPWRKALQWGSQDLTVHKILRLGWLGLWKQTSKCLVSVVFRTRKVSQLGAALAQLRLLQIWRTTKLCRWVGIPIKGCSMFPMLCCCLFNVIYFIWSSACLPSLPIFTSCF